MIAQPCDLAKETETLFPQALIGTTFSVLGHLSGLGRVFTRLSTGCP
jgi:hypothetical protein